MRGSSIDDEPPRVQKLVKEEQRQDRNLSQSSPHTRTQISERKLHERRREEHENNNDDRQPRRRRSRSPRDRRGHRRHRSRSKELYEQDRRRRRSLEYGDERRHSHRDQDHDQDGSTSAPAQQRSHSPRTALPYKRSAAPLRSQDSAYRGDPSTITLDGPIEKQKPDYTRSGKLAAETNTVTGTGIVLKYNEPPESRKPPASADWRLYVFKGQETLETVQLGERTCWLFGRERAVADFPVEHPSCSKQHAVLQFRHVEKKNEFGDRKAEVRPYIIDLESANGTKVNGERVPERRFWEVVSGDVLAFGDSTREYVLMLAPKA